MSGKNISFKSFYYSLGTTSFRMQNFNKKIEQQLDFLNQFWQQPKYENETWECNASVQEAYYNFIKQNEFLKEGDAPRKAKDARQKTSGLRDIGLIDDNRRLTEVGKKLLELSKAKDFESDNFLQIPKDSFIYFQQLLKTYIEIDKDSGIRPFILLARLLKKFMFLSKEEFMYLFPLCINKKSTDFIEGKLICLREKTITVDELIIEVFMQQQNYKDSLEFFIENKSITPETFCKIGLNRKSKEYDKAYFPLYRALRKVYFDNDKSEEAIFELYEASDIKNVKTHWRKILFKTSSGYSIRKSPKEQVQTANMFSVSDDEDEFKTVFFKTMHLIKVKRTLEDYFDLNRRYLKISDTLLFADNQVKFDIIPKHYFSFVQDEFYDLAFEKSEKLAQFQTLEEISPCLEFNESKLLESLNKENGTTFTNICEVKRFVVEERIARFNKLIDERFSDNQLIYILNLISNRSDKEIQDIVTDDADIPTIFEYILGIVWYKISGRQGDILSFMNLSLEADLLPKTHAGGGEADLIFKYEEKEGYYPRHDLLIEATLSDSTNQRRMEMEPVSRHLGEYMLKHRNMESYCVFVTNFLHINVISDFRNRRRMEYYGGKNNSEVINGMMIAPLENNLLIAVLEKGIKYPQLYKLFHELQDSSLAPKEWFENLSEKIKSQN